MTLHRNDSVIEDVVALASLQEQRAALQLSLQTSTKELEEEMARLTERIPRTHSGSRHRVTCSTGTNTARWSDFSQFRISVRKTNCQTPTWFIKLKLDLKRITVKLKLLKPSSGGFSNFNMLVIKTDLTLAQLHTTLKRHYKDNWSLPLADKYQLRKHHQTYLLGGLKSHSGYPQRRLCSQSF